MSPPTGWWIASKPGWHIYPPSPSPSHLPSSNSFTSSSALSLFLSSFLHQCCLLKNHDACGQMSSKPGRKMSRSSRKASAGCQGVQLFKTHLCIVSSSSPPQPQSYGVGMIRSIWIEKIKYERGGWVCGYLTIRGSKCFDISLQWNLPSVVKYAV